LQNANLLTERQYSCPSAGRLTLKAVSAAPQPPLQLRIISGRFSDLIPRVPLLPAPSEQPSLMDSILISNQPSRTCLPLATNSEALWTLITARPGSCLQLPNAHTPMQPTDRCWQAQSLSTSCGYNFTTTTVESNPTPKAPALKTISTSLPGTTGLRPSPSTRTSKLCSAYQLTLARGPVTNLALPWLM
jgi:hypothetical protein